MVNMTASISSNCGVLKAVLDAFEDTDGSPYNQIGVFIEGGESLDDTCICAGDFTIEQLSMFHAELGVMIEAQKRNSLQ